MNLPPRTLRAALAAVAVFATLPAAAAAAPVTIDLRIEGPTTTFFAGPVTTDIRTFDFSGGGDDAKACDATAAAGGSSDTPIVTAGAAVAKVIADGDITATGTIFSFGPSFSLINGTSVAYDGDTGKYLFETKNGAGTSTGMCSTPIADGDQIVLAYAGYGSPVLKLAGPAKVTAGRSATFTVTNLANGNPVEGATIGGATTDANGKATVGPLTETGEQTLKAEKSSAIRSNALDVCVSNGQDGLCGNPSAPVTVDLRIEGPTTTLFDGEVTTGVRTFDFTGGTVAKACDGTADAGGFGSTPVITSGAAVAKVIAEGKLTAAGSIFSFGPSFATINGTSVAYNAETDEYLYETLNGTGASLGLCGQPIASGDEIVLAYAGFGSKVLELDGPSKATLGESATFTVTDAATGDPIEGAKIGEATSDAAGKLTVGPLTTAGEQELKASKTGAIRSRGVKVCVTNGADGFCGTTVPKQDQPTTPADQPKPTTPVAETPGTPQVTAPKNGLKVSGAGKLTLPLTCGSAKCAGKVVITYQPAKKKGKKKPKAVKLGSATIVEGKSSVKVGLTRGGKKAVKGKKKIKVKVTVTPEDGSPAKTITVTLRLPSGL